MPNYATLLQRYNTQLAEQRLLLQQWTSVAITQYDALPAEVRASLPALTGRTAQELVPALFADPITSKEEAEYKEQIAKLEDFVAACNKKFDALNESEVARCRL